MRTLEITRPKLAFVVVTRAVLGVGLGLLASRRLPDRTRRALGTGLVAIGAVSTIPAARWLLAAR